MSALWQVVDKFSFFNAVDIILVALVLYWFLLLIRGTRAVQLLKGVVVILIATAVSSAFHLQALNWLLNKIITIGLFAIPVVFQPELRRALEQLGRGGGFFSLSLWSAGVVEQQAVVHEIVKATQILSRARVGALLVVERKTGLTEYIETGTLIDGKVSAELLVNVFVPNTPLHDGAVIIRGRSLIAAGCFLPLTENRTLDKQLGTRHRAAIGVSEQSDGVVIVVSEETGSVSVSVDGVLHRHLGESALLEQLVSLLAPKQKTNLPFLPRKAES
jgi:diadenylate cyclase